jgi:hypothetical protein
MDKKKKDKKKKDKLMDEHMTNMKSIVVFIADMESKDMPPEVAYATLRNLVILETARAAREGKYDKKKVNRSDAIQVVMGLMAYAQEHNLPLEDDKEKLAEETEKPNSHRPGYL